jgi:hypothetical protein
VPIEATQNSFCIAKLTKYPPSGLGRIASILSTDGNRRDHGVELSPPSAAIAAIAVERTNAIRRGIVIGVYSTAAACSRDGRCNALTLACRPILGRTVIRRHHRDAQVAEPVPRFSVPGQPVDAKGAIAYVVPLLIVGALAHFALSCADPATAEANHSPRVTARVHCNTVVDTSGSILDLPATWSRIRDEELSNFVVKAQCTELRVFTSNEDGFAWHERKRIMLPAPPVDASAPDASPLDNVREARSAVARRKYEAQIAAALHQLDDLTFVGVHAESTNIVGLLHRLGTDVRQNAQSRDHGCRRHPPARISRRCRAHRRRQVRHSRCASRTA